MRIRCLTLSVLSAALLVSCGGGEDDKGQTSESLIGRPSLSLPEYVRGKESFTLVPTGVTNPTGDLGYYWSASWKSGKDTTKLESGSGDGRYTFTTPEKIGTYTVQCVAFADGYYTSSSAATIIVVDPAPNKTVTGVGYSKDKGFIIDDRDGKTYFTTQAGGMTWMKNNLAYSGSGASYRNCPALDEIFGRYYTWSEARNACPEGWHLPSDTEYAQLANSLQGKDGEYSAGGIFKGAAGGLMVDAKFIGTKMWEFWPEVRITDETGFSALPVGYAVDQGSSNIFNGLYSYAAFWTADSDGENGLYRYFYVDKPDVFPNSGDKASFRASVRCVKN